MALSVVVIYSQTFDLGVTLNLTFRFSNSNQLVSSVSSVIDQSMATIISFIV